MKKASWLIVFICLAGTALPQALLAGKGFMGGKGDIVVAEEPADDGGVPTDDGGMPADIEGPLNDNMSTSGALYGDLYKILRYMGAEEYTKYTFSYDSAGRIVSFTQDDEATAIGGAPVLSEVHGYYAAEVIDGEEVTYALGVAPYPSQCVQPVADYNKWGDISSETGLDKNRLPLVVTYDATWTRSECAVGQLVGEPVVDPATGAMTLTVNDYFIPPCDDPVGSAAECTWNDVVYCDGVKWVDLVDEVHFGRLNLSRAPEAVLQAAFDEAITAINNATAISRDAAGRLVLTTNIYEEFETSNGTSCGYELLETVTKTIDSPLENLALYVKLMQDGHLVTPGDEREPIDRSGQGGIPLWKMLELTDGPSGDLRPTINITESSAIPANLIDVSPEVYYTYYICLDASGEEVDPCMVSPTDVMQPESEDKLVMAPDVVSRELKVVPTCPTGIDCEGPFTGIKTDIDSYAPDAADLDFAAAFLAAAAPKYESIGPDLVFYLNSILGINKVVGYSEDGLTDYSKFPQYFNYSKITSYDRPGQFGLRPRPTILVESSTAGTWVETKDVDLMDSNTKIHFQNLSRKIDSETGLPVYEQATTDFLGFTQMADDNLSAIKLIHTYQIPGLR